MKRRKFDEIIEKYCAGKSAPEEEELLDKWAEMHFSQHENHPVFTHDEEALKTRSRIWGKILEEAKISPRNVRWWLKRQVLTGLAASLFLAAAFAYYMAPFSSEKSSATDLTGVETKNITKAPQRVTLPDGSTVVLETGASLVTDEHYGKQGRTVYLTGEAFFEVQPNAKVPFFVYSRDLVTEVLGTSFRVRSEGKSNTIEVSVITGKVSVYTSGSGEDKKRNGIIATRNQKVIYNTELKTLRHDLADSPQIVVPDAQKPDFSFKETHLIDVVKLIQRVYEIEIIIVNPALNHCAFTGDLNGLTLYQQLDFICEVIRARYEIRGTVVFINGENCVGV